MTQGYFGVLLTAMVTPFKEDLSVDFDRAASLAKYLVDLGNDGLVVAGTTGESPTLTDEEKLELFKVVVGAVEGKAKVIAGTGSNNTEKTIAFTRKAAETGVDGVMLVTPYYNKPPQEGLYLHFKRTAEAVDLPILLYNVPGRTGANLKPETAARLAEIENIVALKEASGDLGQVSEVCRLTSDEFTVYSGDDNMTLPILSVGGKGIVSVAAHLIGKEMKEMVTAFHQGNNKRAAELHRRLLPVFRSVFLTANPIPIKTALNMTGFQVGGLRPPLCPLAPELKAQLQSILEGAGLL